MRDGHMMTVTVIMFRDHVLWSDGGDGETASRMACNEGIKDVPTIPGSQTGCTGGKALFVHGSR